jgi:hypothetical protein
MEDKIKHLENKCIKELIISLANEDNYNKRPSPGFDKCWT